MVTLSAASGTRVHVLSPCNCIYLFLVYLFVCGGGEVFNYFYCISDGNIFTGVLALVYNQLASRLKVIFVLLLWLQTVYFYLSFWQLFEGVDRIADVMLANGLVETICNVLSAICSNLPNDDDTRSTNRQSSTSANTGHDLKDVQNNELKISRTEIGEDITEEAARDKPSGRAYSVAEGAVCKDAAGGSLGKEEEKNNLDNVRTLDEISSETSQLDSLHPLRVSAQLDGLTNDQPAGLDTHDEEASERQEAPEMSSHTSSLHPPGEDTRISAAMLVLVKDVQHFMACIANRVFSSSSQFDHFESMLLLLGDMEERHRAKYGPASAITDVVYETQSYIIREVLDHFRATSMSIDAAASKGKKSLSFQRSASYSERKYEEHKWQRNASFSMGSRGSVSSSRRAFPSTSSLSSEISPTPDDTMSVISEDQMTEVGPLEEGETGKQITDIVLQLIPSEHPHH